MSDEIFGTPIYRGMPAWHKKGTVFSPDEQIEPLDAVKRAGADYEIRKLPMVVEWDDGEDVYGVESDLVAVVRGPAHGEPAKILGTTDKNYTIVGPVESAIAIAPLAKVWPVESCFALDQGRGFAISLKIGRVSLGDGKDEIDRFFMVNCNVANGRGTHIAESIVRPVCANTVRMAIEESTTHLMLDHGKDAIEDLQVAARLMAQLRELDTKIVEQLNALVLKTVTEDQVLEIVNAAFPTPKMPKKVSFVQAARSKGLEGVDRFAYAERRYMQDLETSQKLRKTAIVYFDRISGEFPKIAGTAWAAWQGVTETCNYRPGRDELDSLLDGDRHHEMNRALKVALKV
jgi:hypothetical protein